MTFLFPAIAKWFRRKTPDRLRCAHDKSWLIIGFMFHTDWGVFKTQTMSKKELKELIAKLDKECPLLIYTGSSRLFSMVRRMKAERELNIPLVSRTGFAISAKTGKAANRMTKKEWGNFYTDLRKQLKSDYPELHSSLFSKPKKSS